jgi:hypothetical protein
LLSGILILTGFSSFSQDYLFERNSSIQVIWEESELMNAWAGGVNAPQISRIDLDLDGSLDIYMFDRNSNRILTFINEDPTPGAMTYRHTYEYNHIFPEMSEWSLLRDFNCDGKVDIFTKAPNAMTVYENVSTPETGLLFELRAPLLYAEYNYSGVPFDAPVFCVTVDIPAIEDIDGDGDLDILTFSETATTIYFYKNYAQEINNCDSLAFELKNRCYGYFAEASENNTLYLGQDCAFNVIGPKKLHTGGTLFNLDTNADGYLELIIGDVSYTDLIMLTNAPSIEGPDSMILATPNFPAGLGTDIGIDLENFPAGYYEDVNNDGIRDLLACPNNPSQCEDDSSVVLYLNYGANNLSDFTLHSFDFLQNTMMEFGRGALPVVVDYNQDGLMDIFVANEEYYEAGPQPPSKIAVLKNIGTQEEPAFELVDRNYLNLPQYNLLAVYPAFYDLDGDGDIDMLLGDQGGKLHFFKNEAGVGEPFDLILQMPNYTDADDVEIDVGQFATPQFFDIDNDGSADLLVGEKNGNINYYRNTGGNLNPDFTLIEDTIGNVVASNYLGINGYSVPYFFRNGNGDARLLLGTETGKVNYYGNIDGNLEGSFDLIELEFAGIREGDRSAVSLFDMNDDGNPELLYGQVGGGLAWYQGLDTTTVVPNVGEIAALGFDIFPNPTAEFIRIELSNKSLTPTLLEIYDVYGKRVMSFEKTEIPVTIDLSALSEGLYVCQLSMGNIKSSKSFVVLKK